MISGIFIFNRVYRWRSYGGKEKTLPGAVRSLYSQLGFVETGEWEGAEVVARLSLAE